MSQILTTFVSQIVLIALQTLLNLHLHPPWQKRLHHLIILQTTPSSSLPPNETKSTWVGVHLTGAGKDIVLFGYLMVNDLFHVEVAETTVVLRKLLQCHVLRLTEGEDSVAAITYWRLPPNGPGLETSITMFLSEQWWNIDGFLNGLYKGCLLPSKDPECAARDMEEESSSGRDRKDSGLSQHFHMGLGVFNGNFWFLSGHP